MSQFAVTLKVYVCHQNISSVEILIFFSGKSASRTPKISFFVGLSKNHGPKKTSEELKYDRVITNDGLAYDIMTGRFTAPVNGTYHFTVVVAAQGRHKVHGKKDTFIP